MYNKTRVINVTNLLDLILATSAVLWSCQNEADVLVLQSKHVNKLVLYYSKAAWQLILCLHDFDCKTLKEYILLPRLSRHTDNSSYTILRFPRVTFPIAVAAILRHFTKVVAFGANYTLNKQKLYHNVARRKCSSNIPVIRNTWFMTAHARYSPNFSKADPPICTA